MLGVCGDGVVFLLYLLGAEEEEGVRSDIKITANQLAPQCGRVVLFDLLLAMWDTFGKLLGAAGGLGKVVGENALGRVSEKKRNYRV